ncbi:translation initiation factor 2, alpha subunit [Methanolacinia petrolearia DSM 11571]|uniref:Translation initiation factor 2 subunit alpha n=1 Tax=Methanolacinia petrolearia (strain DSM 11571 / OCM 486 / SEBR 4847) TaxID=679926 RepID=E1RI59_METP4|nr:translation initiation factor IF-2 subunit alpha [Methanolacinia petrolearia]ADN36524.1 translation initiation factor 2, alpha subunit [Methanolacinia petrolearia DSM 11571]
MYEREWPEEGELVVCTVTSVKDFVAFVTLDEYNNNEGLIPIAEVARGWIKHIRDFVREGQKVVCKVLHVNKSRGHIDLSLKDVNDHQRKEKINEWKNEQKARKWIEFISEASGFPGDEIEKIFYREYGALFPVFEDILIDEETTLKKLDLEKKVADSLVSIANDNVKLPKVTISGTLILTSNKPDGVNVIRRALRSANPKVEEDVEIELFYVGAPKYRVKVTAPDYKSAEKAINKVAKAAIGVVERAEGYGEFVRKQKSGKN